MPTRMVIGIVALVGASACRIMATLTQQAMVREVDGKLPAMKQFHPVGWYWEKTRRLHREYRRLFPEGRLHWKERALGVSMLVCILICMWAIGFFSL
jgi:hypothetical protein